MVDINRSDVENGDIREKNENFDVIAWLDRIGCAQYVDAFHKNGIDADILRSLTSEELRDDLGVVNLRHRRNILYEISLLGEPPRDTLPEHGRILNHLSNVRTYHSWVRVGVQLLAYSVAFLRLIPIQRGKDITTAFSFAIALSGILFLTYAAHRYKLVIQMIENSGQNNQAYQPDIFGVVISLVILSILSVLTITIIVLDGFAQ